METENLITKLESDLAFTESENEKLLDQLRNLDDLCGDMAGYLQADESEAAMELKHRYEEINQPEQSSKYEALKIVAGELADWIKCECQPCAEFAGQGHNMSMNDEDRERAKVLLEKFNQLCK
jgi:hypothetical protein